jgi:hypothetical protein
MQVNPETQPPTTTTVVYIIFQLRHNRTHMPASLLGGPNGRVSNLVPCAHRRYLP